MSSEEEYVYESGSGEEEYVYSDEDGSGSDHSEVGSDVELENKFWEADGLKREEPTESLRIFTVFLDGEEKRVKEGKERLQHEDVGSMRLRVLFEVVLLCYNLKQYENMLKHYESLLQFLQHATRNERARAISEVIGAITSGQGAGASPSGEADTVRTDIAMKIYEMTLKVLEGSNIDTRLAFSTKKNLGIMYFEKGDYAKTQETLVSLHKMCTTGDGGDDQGKAEWLLEMYSLEIQLCNARNDSLRMKAIFKKTAKLKNAIRDPRTMGIIHESGGKLYMKERNWSEAYNQFFEGFKNYQETADPRAQTCLKYVVLANMLASSDINPFDSHEAKAYQDYPEVKAIISLRNAYDNSDAKGFEDALNDPRANLVEDSFLVSFIEPLMTEIRSKVLKKLIKPYRTVRLSFIANHLNVAEDNVEEIVVRLIMDGLLDGKIDQLTSTLHLGSALKNQKYQALNTWIDSLGKLEKSFEKHPALFTLD